MSVVEESVFGDPAVTDARDDADAPLVGESALGVALPGLAAGLDAFCDVFLAAPEAAAFAAGCDVFLDATEGALLDPVLDGAELADASGKEDGALARVRGEPLGVLA